MDKQGSKSKSAEAIREGSLLPPTRKVAVAVAPLAELPAQDKRLLKNWSMEAFFRRVTSLLDAQTSSSSQEDLSERHRPRYRGKSKSSVCRPSGYSFKSHADDSAPAGAYRNANSNNNNNNYDGEELANNEDRLNANMDVFEAQLASNPSCTRSSDGSLEGGTRRIRTNKVKARVEAKRDQLYVDDSSVDESSTEESLGNGPPLPKPDCTRTGKRRSRASRTARYLKRMCNGVDYHPTITVINHRVLLKAPVGKAFQPIDRVPTSQRPMNLGNRDTCFVNDSPKENLYDPQSNIGVNPLVQQTLQYFSEFDRHMVGNRKLQQQPKARKNNSVQFQCRNICKSQTYSDNSHMSNVTPPMPPSRDHTSRVLIKGIPMDKYQQMLRSVQGPPSENHFTNDKNGSYAGTSLSQQNSEVRNINHKSTNPRFLLPLSPPRSPLKESHNVTHTGVTRSLIERNHSPLLDLNQSKYQSQLLSLQDYHNPNYVPHKKLVDAIEKQPTERRSSKNLEEALCELEDIYNSLQLGDEELLERAERRTMEEFHYKGFTAGPDSRGNGNSTSRRKTWAEQTLSDCREESNTPDRLKDDMAYRRMHPKERPSSTDGQSSLSSISYLMTSPISSRREVSYVDLKRKSHRKEPDVTLDDVVFRSMQYTNNSLKVVEPQPPFGIPLGPITAATESDYLHTNPTKSERSRSPYIPSCEPDIVTDDLAFRNLRKDAQPSSTNTRQPSLSFLHESITSDNICTLPLSFRLKKKRAVRSLSANLYGLINKPMLPLNMGSVNQTSIADDSILDDIFNDIPIKFISRRTSDPELMCTNWQTNVRDNLVNNENEIKNEKKQQTFQKQLSNSLSISLSDQSCDESSDEKNFSRNRLIHVQKDGEHKTVGSEVGSSYLSSKCSTPSLSIPACSAEPFTEQEISVYKKLCEDLENLIQLTKGIDGIPTCSESAVITLSSIPSSDVIVIRKHCNVPSFEETMNDGVSAINSSSKSNIEHILVNNVNNDRLDCKSEIEISSIEREISMILDNLKLIRKDSNPINSSYSDEENNEKNNENKENVVDDKNSIEITKEICDLVTWDDKNDELSMKVKEKEIKFERLREENDEKKGCIDDLLFRNVQLAKLSDNWKESTPNNNDSENIVTVGNQRTSLTNGDTNSNWEGEIRACEERVTMVYNASQMSQLTAKYICYITNHITAQFCLLLVFFLVLLLAIVTVP